MKRFCFAICLVLYVHAFAQNSIDEPNDYHQPHCEIIDSIHIVNEHFEASQDTIYTIVEYMPIYPGGNAELLKFIHNNIEYPVEAIELGIECVVVVKCVIDTTGQAIDPVVLKTCSTLLSQPAKNIIAKLPKFKPAMQNGKIVPAYFVMPIKFELSSVNK